MLDSPHIAMAWWAYNLKSVCNDPDSHKLLPVVAAIHHKGISETLNDRALCLAEPLDGIATC